MQICHDTIQLSKVPTGVLSKATGQFLDLATEQYPDIAL